jgi:2-polyprenyl-3-methyl-5-hydroxy-6-metoxy-1,4-benzoquinol methylase
LKSAKTRDEYSLEAKIYDKIWGKYGYDSDIKFLDSLFKRHHCKTIIDIGCGTGNHATRLSKHGYQVTGIDISQSMLKIAKTKDKRAKIQFKQGDMKKLSTVIPKTRRFDAAISLGQVSSHLYTDNEAQTFLNGVHSILKTNGLFVLSARNAKKINDEYLDKLRLDHMIINEEKLQLVILAQNSRDHQDPNTMVWRPIYLIKEHGKVDLQIREHKLRWFEFSDLKKLLTENGFETKAVYSETGKEPFDENIHAEMWFIATAN